VTEWRRVIERCTELTNARPYTTGSVTSRDGTVIAYRQLGRGPGLILVHGGMQASQNFMRLATELADAFTLYIPDRRGRGLSGPPGDRYSITKECEDFDALVTGCGLQNVFGLSSGALISLQAALTSPAIKKVALYEPPLSIDHSSPIAWVTRFDREIAQGELGAALVTVLKGIQASPFFSAMPRFLLVPLMKLAIVSQAKNVRGDDVPLKSLVPTMHFDVQLVIEMEGALESFRAVGADVLLLGGNKSQAFLRAALDALNAVLPRVRRVELEGLDHLGPDNDGRPERVAIELRRFFAE
jgi:pimeloyl-ACP methyl ester carboxylesterase